MAKTFLLINYLDASLTQLSIHKVGNKYLDESLTLSEHEIQVKDEVLADLLMNFFLKPFEKVNQIFRFYHSNGDLNLNEIFHFAERIFDDKMAFHENSKEVAKHLYDIANHPKIKSGELYVCRFSGLLLEGESLEAVGLFKSETKEPFLTIAQKDKDFEMGYEQQAININKLDKGCLIFNVEKEEGYKVAVVDQTNRSEALYWTDEFLKLKVRNDNYNQTENILDVCKSYVTKQIDQEFEISKPDKIDLLNRSIKYFKEKDQFNFDEFSNEVLGNELGIESFKNFKRNYEQEFETEIADTFEISNAAVKKQSRVFKSVLKLDRNFHIYIHGNRELIEKGYDDQIKMNYYKVYFREEN